MNLCVWGRGEREREREGEEGLKRIDKLKV